ncbi:epoxide hydrolase 2, cytoplasmic L homeolog [Xenopus laevis]|uniref:Bifunctional epoxide hydrolase 2 n=1 Tax=Xenopus laevis TaxID=8355 RepID=Q6DCH2_XENLA|nr:epoxide hydrolase 2, cytoplasmic L homeolog [Xenopus laevis]AAH78066.1 Ephx2-prov protein [Xenopus laevis]
MAGKRFVLFDLGGVLLTPGPQSAFQRLETSLHLPSGFLQNVFTRSGSEGPFAMAERGKIPFSKFVAEMNKECRAFAEESGVSLPESFSLEQAFHGMFENGGINKPMLKAAVKLRHHGFKTCVLTNNWIDDSPQRSLSAEVLSSLSRHFDLVVESCRIGMRKPETQIYEYALKLLHAKPKETIFLDDIGANLKPAREMGIATVLVKDTETALKELQALSNVPLIENEEVAPIPANPDKVTHGFVTVKPGVKLHYVEMGNGPVICLCHGFPESWYSWRFQIPALADAGFRVIAFDMKGYGDSSAPHEIEEYSQEQICKDLVSFLDALGISQASFIGHDWGGAVVWNMALFYPERVRAVASLNTPFFTSEPGVNALERIKANPIFDYQLYFQEPGVAEAELEKNLERTFKVFFRGSSEKDRLPTTLTTMNVRERGGILVGTDEDTPLSSIINEADLHYYVAQFKKSGFRGPLNWYRNMQRNSEWSISAHGWKILVPALMVTAGKDFVLLPIMTKGMENLIPNLSRGHIEECSHWTQMERPAAVNEILIKWLGEVLNLPVTSKL